jgi:PAS domain S-box-containing protein
VNSKAAGAAAHAMARSASGPFRAEPQGSENTASGTAAGQAMENIAYTRAAERTLPISDERLRVTLESASLGTWTYSPDTGSFSADRQTNTLHGFDPSQSLDRNRLVSAVHPEDRDSIFSFLDVHRSEGAKYFAEVRCPLRDGSLRWIGYCARYVADPVDGTQRWLGVVWDASARKEAEKSLRESESRFRLLAETVPDILLTSPGDLTCDYINRRAVEYTGLPVATLLTSAGLDVIHPEDRPPFVESVMNSWRTGTPMVHELRGRRADGSYRWHRMKFVPVRDADGKSVKWFGACTDIDDLKRLGQELELKTFELQELNRRLVESNSDLQQFAGILAHDLQSPLNAIMLLADELGHRIVDRESADSLTSMMKSVRRMHSLIRNVLDYSQAEWGGSKSFVAVESNELLQRTLEVLAGEIRSSASKVTWDQLPTVIGDPEQIASLFQNLIGNAIKYRKPGSAAHVHVSAVEREREWLFSVRDEGIGIPQPDTRRIFRIFERLGRKAESDGAGIGLAICQRVVERHGGRIWVESELGNGSTFYFTLPFTPKSASS